MKYNRKKAEALLAKANDVLDEKGWTAHTLVNERGAHCALGAIGHARFGEKFDTAERFAMEGMEMLKNDPTTREAAFLLANEIRGKTGRKLIELSDPPKPGRDEYGCYQYDDKWETVVQTVVEYNDSTVSRRGVRVRNRFAKWKKDMTAKRHAKKKVTPVDHPLEVEIMGSPVVAPKQVEVTA